VWTLILTSLLGVGVVTRAFRQLRANQARAEAKAYRARIQEASAELAKLIAGDISLEKAAQEIGRFLARRLEVVASQIFISDLGGLRMLASFGAKEQTPDGLQPQRSLVNEAFEHDGIWELSDVPPDYWKISSGLGESVPPNLVFLPLSFQRRKIGVVELAVFGKLSGERRELLERSAEAIGICFSAAQSREHLNRLLEETQAQADALQTQQEELRKKNVILQEQARALESQQQALSLKNRDLEIVHFDLQEKAAKLQRASRYKSEFLAKMSHELRTPLNGMMVYSTLLSENREKTLTPQQVRFAQSITKAGKDLLFLVNDILDLSKIEVRKLALHLEEFSIAALFAQKAQMFTPQAAAKGLALKTTLGSGTENLKLKTDRRRLEQILRNLLANAIKFTANGHISLEAESVNGGEAVKIIVRDTGIGIAADEFKVVFEAFEQGDSSVSHRFGGTGLGLTISRELAHLLGGEITLESEEGKGSTFTLTIPAVLSLVEAQARAQVEPVIKAVVHERPSDPLH
jgi:signal transduction histidine kinase